MAVQDVIDAANAALLPIVTAIANRQAVYFAAKGRYFQGICTHSTMPADGVDASPDKLSGHPTDQSETWSDVNLSGSPKFCLTVHTYQTTTGYGYHIIAQIKVGANYYERAVSVGPDSLAHGWQQTDVPQALGQPIQPPK